MDVRGNSHACMKFAQYSDASGLLIFVKSQKFNARIRARLPLLLLG